MGRIVYMRIAFIWQGLSGRYGFWQDGLYAAMKLLEQEHEVRYFDFPLEGLHGFKPDIVLYWESPVTQFSRDAHNWNTVCMLPYPKCLLFAGGPLRAMDVKDFDLVFVESRINEEDCERQGIPYKRAFGTNTQLFKPVETPKIYDAFMHATFAGWKRHELFAEAVGSKGALAGRRQEHDDNGYQRSVKLGVTIFPEQNAEALSKLISSSWVVLNTSNFEGGGQRCTLEAMACGVPVIVMADSPKNREFVEDCGGGYIVEPSPEAIRNCIENIKTDPTEASLKGEMARTYVARFWSETEYRDSLLEGIQSII